MWRNELLLLISAVLVSLAFGQEPAQKAAFPSEPAAPTARLGRLFVGGGVKLLAGEAEKNNGREVQDGRTEHSERPQSAQQGSTVWYKAAESKLRRLNPSVRCGDDAMALRVQGSRVPNFMVDRGEDGLLPVSQMPANCGFSVKRARRDVLLTANYKGCHVMQEGEAYILILRLWGAPVSMSCPVATSTQTVSPTTTASPDTTTAPIPARDAQKPVSPYDQIYPFDGVPYWHPYYQYGYPWGRLSRTTTASPDTTTASPDTTTASPDTTTASPDTTTASPDTTTAPIPARDAQKPVSPYDQIYPFDVVPYWHPYYQYGYPWGHLSRTTTASPDTTTLSPDTTTAPIPARDAQKPVSPYDQIYPFDRVPYWHPYYKYGYPWGRLTRTPTVAPTTTASPDTTTTSPDTTTAPIPARDAQKPVSPYDQIYPFDRVPYWYPYYQYGYPWARPTPTPTASTATTTAPTLPARDSQKPGSHFDQLYPFGHVPHWNPYYQIGYPRDCSTSTPTMAPPTIASMDTTAPTLPASDQEPGSPFAKVFPLGHFPYRHWRPHF